ncbi:MAG: hypothetical protein RQM92_02235 [Candidatus Syntrophopropionicum ammoniitolerans]
MGTMTADADYEVKNGRIHIIKEGDIKKYVNKVTQVTFSGRNSLENKQKIIYVTERAVFTLEKGELTLIEIAPGLDLAKDILAVMEFAPKISPKLKEMPQEIFLPVWGKLKQIIEAY